jgi:hypothetical protein
MSSNSGKNRQRSGLADPGRFLAMRTRPREWISIPRYAAKDVQCNFQAVNLAVHDLNPAFTSARIKN